METKNINKKILEMLRMQNQINSKINPEWREENNPWYRAGWIELAEAMDHHGYKWWKKQTTDLSQLKLEVVDIMHFALSISLQDKYRLEDTVYSIKAAFDLPKSSETLLETIEEAVLDILATKSINYRYLSGIMNHIGMSFDELYKIYIAKNVLNRFRQDNGYKEGTYIKDWDGKEDNEYLTIIINKLNGENPDFYENVYDELKRLYNCLSC